MGIKDSIAFVKKLWILLFLFLLIIPNKSIAQPDTLKLHRIWAIDLYEDITALRLADLDGDGVNEIFVGLWDGDSGYIEVFSGLNGILIKRSEKNPAHKIIDLDVGDIDGDDHLELVVGADTSFWQDSSLVCAFDVVDLHLDWEKRIQHKVKTIEVHDINYDGTAEVFIGTSYWRYRWYWEFGFDCYESLHKGALFYWNSKDTVLNCIDTSMAYCKFLVADINKDSFDEIVCGTFYDSSYECWALGIHSLAGYRTVELQVLHKNNTLTKLCTLYNGGTYTRSPNVTSLAVGNFDSNDNVSVVSYTYSGRDARYDWTYDDYYSGPPGYILSMVDASSGVVTNVMPCSSSAEAAVAVAVFDLNAQPPDEILIAHSNGVIQAFDGTTFDTLAISDPLPPISFFAFGDVTGDALPEICISDGDSLFLYGFGPTGVEEQDEVELASEFNLNQNYPNPFNTQTTIRYYLPTSSKVELSIYNIKGQKVKTVVDGFQTIGFQSVTWDGTNRNGEKVASGIYFYCIRTYYSEKTRKMVLLK